jgi:hypothetical protein
LRARAPQRRDLTPVTAPLWRAHALAAGAPGGAGAGAGAGPPEGARSWRAAHDAAVAAARTRADALGQRLRGTYEAAAALKAARRIQARAPREGLACASAPVGFPAFGGANNS